MPEIAPGMVAQDRAGFGRGIDQVSLSSEYGRNVAQVQISFRFARLPVLGHK